VGYHFRYLPGLNEYHTIKSSADGQGVEWTLRELVQLWTGERPPGVPLASRAHAARQCRWQTVKLLRTLRLVWASPGAAIPAPYAPIAAAPRVSTVGISIGSNLCKYKKAHIDRDWFGPEPSPANTATPPGQAPVHNWWKPAVDGAAFEQHFAEKLLHYLEDSLGLGPSDALPAGWTWPPGTAPADPVAALADATIDQEVLARAANHGFEGLSMVWHVGNQSHPNPPVMLQCSSAAKRNGKAFIIKSPDCNAPDPNK
jgi:hypothetical protein